MKEYMEFETSGEKATGEDIVKSLKETMPVGMDLKRIIAADWLKRTLAAETIAAEYLIDIPVTDFHVKNRAKR